MQFCKDFCPKAFDAVFQSSLPIFVKRKMSKSPTSLVCTIFTIAGILTGGGAAVNSAHGQTLRKDYRLDAPIQYQPNDPFVRGRVYKNHVGHAGLFYNCDNEECKRNSPYICWKGENRACDEKGISLWRRQLDEAIWRFRVGKCCDEPYPGCPCEPGVCLACNTHSGAADIDYTRVRNMSGIAPTQSRMNDMNLQQAPAPSDLQRQPSTSDYYRGTSNITSSRRLRGITMFQRIEQEKQFEQERSLPRKKSIAYNSQTMSIKEALEQRRRDLAQHVEMKTKSSSTSKALVKSSRQDKNEMTQAERVRLLRSAMSGSNKRIR